MNYTSISSFNMYSFNKKEPDPKKPKHWIELESEAKKIAQDMISTGESNISYINDIVATNYPEIPYKRVKQLVLEGMFSASKN